MDLIYMNADREDIGVLHEYELDLAFGSDENSFECVVAKNNHCCGFGFFLYIDGTEYGGIIDSVTSKNSTQEVVYSGRTWHGILNSMILQPDSGEDYLICSGEANAVVAELISRMGFSNLFLVSTEDSGLEIKSYKMNRYISGYEGILKMLKTVGGKLRLCVQSNGQVLLSVVPIVDYTTDGLDSDVIALDVKRTENTVNHLICLGPGNLSERLIVHLYVDEDGNISQTQTFFGADEYVAVFDYGNAESEDDLIKNGKERLAELMKQDSVSVDVNDVGDPYDIGDLVGASDSITGIQIAIPVNKKIVTIKNGAAAINIQTDTGNTAVSGSAGSSSGSTVPEDLTEQIDTLESQMDALEKRLEEHINPYVNISVSAKSLGTYEKGVTIDKVTVKWTVNRTPQSLTISGPGIDGTKVLAVTDTSYEVPNKELGITWGNTNSFKWKITVTGDKGEVRMATTSPITFQNRIYYGTAPDPRDSGGKIDGDFIKSLQKNPLSGGKIQSFNVDAKNGEYVWYCLPQWMGQCTFVYIANVLVWDEFTASLELVDGSSEPYYVYRSTNEGLGNLTLGVN